MFGFQRLLLRDCRFVPEEWLWRQLTYGKPIIL